MIQPKDIRVDNIVEYLIKDDLDERKEWYDTHYIDADDIKECAEDNEIFNKFHKPIPFTTEWAERFGLIGKVINGLCISQSEYQGHEYDLCLYDEHTWDSERRVICPIYYVHQCQNIFLDLAGHIIE